MRDVVVIRPLSPSDSSTELTTLLHRAYASLAAAGMQFVASHQSSETTKERCERGACFVAELSGKLIGTITLYSPNPESGCEHYREPGNFHFGQFAVDPDHQGRGIGMRLLAQVEQQARMLGAHTLSLDTSERAADLIAFYTRLGFQEVGRIYWGDVVNYQSVILSKKLSD